MTIREIEKAVLSLRPKELVEFRKWFEEKDAQAWDHAFESDARSGKLDKVAYQNILDFKQGQFKTL